MEELVEEKTTEKNNLIKRRKKLEEEANSSTITKNSSELFMSKWEGDQTEFMLLQKKVDLLKKVKHPTEKMLPIKSRSVRRKTPEESFERKKKIDKIGLYKNLIQFYHKE